MKKNKKSLSYFGEEEVIQLKRRLLNIYVRRSFFCIFICFIICGALLIISSSKIYKKQREVIEIKSKINKAVEELESLELEILNLKGFDKVIEYAEYLDMNPPKLGEAIFVDLNKDNFDSEDEEYPDKPFILKIYDKMIGKSD